MELQTVNIETRELKKDSYSIYYFVSGNKHGELIVFLHPAFANHGCFDAQLAFFAKSHRVITIDLLGHGLSTNTSTSETIDASVQHINEILSLEGFEKAHFSGVSMGALVAQAFADNYPNKVQSLTVTGAYNIRTYSRQIAKAQRAANIKMIFMALFSMNAFRRFVASVAVAEPIEQEKFFEMAQSFTRKSFRGMAGLEKILKKKVHEKREYPLLILSGIKDLEVVKSSSKLWHESEPTSRFAIIENAGHCVNMDNPEAFNKIQAEFIASNSSHNE
jgi:3-oxoadipate enol-lactonase